MSFSTRKLSVIGSALALLCGNASAGPINPELLSVPALSANITTGDTTMQFAFYSNRKLYG